MQMTLHLITNDASLKKKITELFLPLGMIINHFLHAKKFLQKRDNCLPGCILLDVNSEEVDVLRFLNHLKSDIPLFAVIILTNFKDIALAIEAMHLGAKDIMLKPFNDQLLVEAVYRDAPEISTNQAKIGSLSHREKEILYLITEGEINKSIAIHLNLSRSTIEAHRRNIMKKLGVSNKAQLIKLCLEERI